MTGRSSSPSTIAWERPTPASSRPLSCAPQPKRWPVNSTRVLWMAPSPIQEQDQAMASRPSSRSRTTTASSPNGLVRAHSIGRRASRGRALGEHEQAEQGVQRRQAGGGQERQPQAVRAQQAAQRGPTTSRRRRWRRSAEQPRPVLRPRHVGDVGGGAAATLAEWRGDQAAGEQPPQVGREHEQEVVEAQPGDGEQDHRPPAEAVAQRRQQRGRSGTGWRRKRRSGAPTQGAAAGPGGGPGRGPGRARSAR